MSWSGKGQERSDSRWLIRISFSSFFFLKEMLQNLGCCDQRQAEKYRAYNWGRMQPGRRVGLGATVLKKTLGARGFGRCVLVVTRPGIILVFSTSNPGMLSLQHSLEPSRRIGHSWLFFLSGNANSTPTEKWW